LFIDHLIVRRFGIKKFEKEIINASIMNKEIIFLGDLNTDYLKHVPTSWETILTTHAGLSFEAGCRRNSTSTLCRRLLFMYQG
jgi:hypothetical protein